MPLSPSSYYKGFLCLSGSHKKAGSVTHKEVTIMENILSEVFGIWFLIGAAFGILHAGRIRHGRDRIYPGKKCRKHHHEKSHGFLYRNGCIYLPWALELLLRRGCTGRLHRNPELSASSQITQISTGLTFVFNLVFCATSRNHRFRSHGRTYQLLILLYLLRRDFCSGISD